MPLGYPLWSTSDCPIVQDFNTALLFAAKNASIRTIQVLLESGAHIEAKNTKVTEIILLYTEIPQIRLEMKNTCRADDAFNNVCLAGVYDGMMTIAMHDMFTNARHSHAPLA